MQVNDGAQKVLYGFGVFSLFTVGVLLAQSYDIEVSVDPVAPLSDSSSNYQPSYDRQPGPQLVMTYFGSSTCGWSNEAALPDAVEDIKIELARYAQRRGLAFKAVGVALDWVPERGLDHLAEFGQFDEVSAGYNWGNGVALRDLWANPPPTIATPTIVVSQRQFIAPLDSTDVLDFGERERRNLLRKTGLDEITEWAQAGAPLEKIEGG